MCAYSTPARSLASKTLQSALRTAATRRLSKPHSGWKLYTAECPLPGVCLLDLSGSLSRACGHLQPKAQREPGPDASGVRTRSPQICPRPSALRAGSLCHRGCHGQTSGGFSVACSSCGANQQTGTRAPTDFAQGKPGCTGQQARPGARPRLRHSENRCPVSVPGSEITFLRNS